MANRKKVYEITNGRCFYCGCKISIDNFETDHFVAKACGGSGINNLVPACRECNQCKGSLDIEQFRAKIEALPYKRFTGRMIAKYYKVKKRKIRFFFEEVKDGNIQNRVNDILDRP